MKGRFVILTLALVTVLCILGAGCTSQETAADPLVGTWDLTSTYPGVGYTSTQTFFADGTGNTTFTYTDGTVEKHDCTWQKITDKKYRTYYNNYEWAIYLNDDNTYHEQQIWIYQNSGEINTVNPILGTWTTRSEGNTYHDTFTEDGTGSEIKTLPDGTTEEYTLTWEQDGNSYKVVRSDGHHYVYTYDEKNRVIEAQEMWEYKNRKMENTGTVNTENPIVGKWKCELGSDSYFATFYEDGTATELEILKDERKVINNSMTWKKSGSGYILTYGKDNICWVSISDDGKTLTTEDIYVFKKRT